MIRIAMLVITAVITGCASTPAYLNAALSDETDCLAHAVTAQERLGRGEIVTGIVPRQNFKHHAVLVVDGYVVDNGALAGMGWRVFPESELDRHLEPYE